ncbi:flavoprotein-like protein [Aspergillus granulosus]|uniref:Flavoprotein-like protein n=1 Tax=Aspergillus granulosus TaxID=176169 RepID=A0ABR4GVP1_9EURO
MATITPNTPNGQTKPRGSDIANIVSHIPPFRTLAVPSTEDDTEIRQKYRPFLLDSDSTPDWVSNLELTSVLDMAEKDLAATNSRLKVLVLYGSLRRRSYSRLVAFEASRILFRLGCDVRVFNPEGLPVKNDTEHTHPKVQELRALSAWSDGHVWISPEQHGNLTAVFKNQIDWIPLSTGSIRPTQGRTLAIGQVCGGSQSFNAVNSLRILGRWMRMFTIPNQSSIPMAYTHFPDEGQEGDQRLKASSNRDRLVDCMEEFVKYTILMRPHIKAFGDRFSEREERRIKEARAKTAVAEDLARVRNNQRKSRERKRQHVTELEQKVKQLESAAAAAEESMLSMSLARENRMLRSILESIGVDSVSLEGYLRGAAFGGLQESLESDFMDPAGSVPGMGLVGLEPMSMPTDQLGPLSGNEPSSSISTADLFNPAALDFSYSAQTLEADRMPLDIFQRQAPAWNTHLSIPEDLAGVLHTLGGEASQSANSVNSETTLCSVAFNLIIQCNRTGKNVLELETRLRYAYKMPTSPGEGCRVDNETLLAVLAELVSDAGLGRYQDYLG